MSWLRITRTFPDGYTDAWSVEWPGWTAADTRKNWRDRARAAGWTHHWDGDTLVRNEPFGEERITVRHSFHETEPGVEPVQDALPEGVR